MKEQPRFIIVDDDAFCNTICRYAIRKTVPGAEISDFILPAKGIEYIESHYADPETNQPTVLILDINMPGLNGWSFLERYARLESYIKNQFTIYILTSSVSSSDRIRATANKYIKAYLVKPFTNEMIRQIQRDANQ